jgi:hypothetical protein
VPPLPDQLPLRLQAAALEQFDASKTCLLEKEEIGSNADVMDQICAQFRRVFVVVNAALADGRIGRGLAGESAA